MKLELKGPDNSLRLRQVKVLGEIEGKECRIRNTKNTLKMQQDNCEAETLKVFRLLTSQVSSQSSFSIVFEFIIGI